MLLSMVFLIRPFSNIRTLCGVYVFHAFRGGQLLCTQWVWENLGGRSKSIIFERMYFMDVPTYLGRI